MCELEQGGYLDGKREDVDIDFADKLMDLEKSSYQYREENEDVNMRSFEGRKDCFAETNQHGRMEDKASVEAEVPYVF